VAQLQLSLLGFHGETRRGRGVITTLVAAQPKQHVMPAPTDSPSMKPLLLGEASEKSQRLKHPTGAAREPGYFMGGQERLAGGKTLIHPSRE
jgi:hypothetical protein